ncbi:hypothetical protein [Variovorax paradoxus]|uniref:hypothetical protein n=1 Tax=Variovorax paradoxus TaxID=34073 RepID=UPI0027D9189B|nr:hypothetical protein [Variovorax paradoxus]
MNDHATTQDIHLTTIEGHDVAVDPATHAGLLGLDVDLSRLCVVGADVRVYRKSRDELHGLTLETLADLIAPPKPKQIPKTTKGEAIIAAAAFACISSKTPSTATYHPPTGKGGPPPLFVNGRKVRAPLPDTTGPSTRVVLVDSRRNLIGHAVLPTSAYRDLVRHPKTRVDSSTWMLGANGAVTMRCRAMDPPQIMDLGALLGVLRRPADFTVETLA